MILGGWRVSWWSVGVGVVGVGAGRGLRLGGRRFRACHSWLVVGRLVVLVVPVVSGVGVFPSAVLGSVVVGVAPVVVEGVDAVGGWGVAVLPLSVVLGTVLVRAPPAELWVLAPPVMPKARAL